MGFQTQGSSVVELEEGGRRHWRGRNAVVDRAGIDSGERRNWDPPHLQTSWH